MEVLPELGLQSVGPIKASTLDQATEDAEAVLVDGRIRDQLFKAPGQAGGLAGRLASGSYHGCGQVMIQGELHLGHADSAPSRVRHQTSHVVCPAVLI